MYTRPQLIEAEVSTTEKENTMADRAIANWLNRREKRRSASVDNDMTDVHTNEDKFFPLTKDCHHYTRRADVDWDIQKYVLVPQTHYSSNSFQVLGPALQHILVI
jgi:hypothetical protein